MLHKEKTNCKQIILHVFHLVRKLKIIPFFSKWLQPPLDFRGIQDTDVFTHDAFTKTVTTSHCFSVTVEPTSLYL